MATTERKIDFKWLLTLSSIFKGLAVILLIISIIVIVIGIVEVINWGGFDELGGVLFFSGIGGILSFSLPFFTVAELIKLFIRIEFNTRKDNAVYSDKRTELSHGEQKHKKNLNKEEETIPQSYMEWECPKCKTINESNYNTCVSCGYSLP